MTLKFSAFLVVVTIHVRAKFHRAKCSGSCVIVGTNKKMTKTIPQTVIKTKNNMIPSVRRPTHEITETRSARIASVYRSSKEWKIVQKHGKKLFYTTSADAVACAQRQILDLSDLTK